MTYAGPFNTQTHTRLSNRQTTPLLPPKHSDGMSHQPSVGNAKHTHTHTDTHTQIEYETLISKQ